MWHLPVKREENRKADASSFASCIFVLGPPKMRVFVNDFKCVTSSENRYILEERMYNLSVTIKDGLVDL